MSLYQDLNTGFLEVSCLFAAQKGPKPVLAFNLFRDTKGLEAIKAEGVAEWQRLGGPPFLTPEVMHYTDGNKRCAHGALALGIARYLDRNKGTSVFAQVEEVVGRCFVYEQKSLSNKKRGSQADLSGQSIPKAAKHEKTDEELMEWFSAEEKEAREEATQAFQAFQLNVLKQSGENRTAFVKALKGHQGEPEEYYRITERGAQAMKALHKATKAMEEFEAAADSSQDTATLASQVEKFQVDVVDGIVSAGLPPVEAEFVQARRKAVSNRIEDLLAKLSAPATASST